MDKEQESVCNAEVPLIQPEKSPNLTDFKLS